MANNIAYNGSDEWKIKATELLNQGGGGGGGNVDDVKVNGTSVVDANKVAQIDLTPYAESEDLATVATSGSYNDLSNKPSIPAAQVNSDWNASSGVAEILNKPSLATVATSGSYTDLSNKPTDATQSASGLMSSTDKTKLDGIASGAEVNVQSDWSQSDNTAKDYIKNKPSIPSTASDVGAIPTTEKGANSGVATLDSSGKVPSSQLDLSGKQDTITGGASTITSSNLTASKVLVSDSNGKVAASSITETELGYLDGVTRNITQYFANKTYSSSTAVDNMRGDAFNGVYWLSTTQWSGMPVGSYGYLEVMGNMQRWTAYGTSNAAKTMTRMYINNTWTPWKYVNEGYNSYEAWQKTSAVSISNLTNTTIISDITLTAGVWCITATAEWAYNASGIRRIYLTNSSTSVTPLSYMRDTRIAGTDSNQSALSNNFSMIVNLTASTTLYLRAVQTSGSTLSINSARVATARIL